MAITYLTNGTQVANNGGSNPSPGIPAGCTAGSTVMLCFFYSRGNVDESVSISTGWDEVVNTRTSGGLLALWRRVFQTGDSAPTITRTNFSGGSSGDTLITVILAFNGVDTTTPIAQIGTVSTNGAQNNIGPISGITLASVASSTVIVFAGKRTSRLSCNVLSGDSLTWAEAWDQSATAGGDATLSIQYAIDEVGGTTVTDKTITVNGTSSIEGIGVMLELKPLVEGAQVELDASGNLILESELDLNKSVLLAGIPSLQIDSNAVLANLKSLDLSASLEFLSSNDIFLQKYFDINSYIELDSYADIDIGMKLPYELDENGWSILPPLNTGAGDREIYVATPAQGGSNSNDGLSELTPKATLAAGKALMRNGYGDRLYLKCDGFWEETFGFMLSGRSNEERHIISSYGTGNRPVLQGSAISSIFSAQFGGTVNNFSIINIEGRFSGYTGGDGGTFLNIVGASNNNILVEGCFAQTGALFINATPQNRHSNIAVYRNVAHKMYQHGFFFTKVDGLLVDQNYVSYGGWDPNVPATISNGGFRHGIYIQADNTDVSMKENIVISSAGQGTHFRAGGYCYNNLYVACPSAIQVGGGSPPLSGGISARVLYNVIQEATNIVGGSPQGWGIIGYNISQPSEIRYNLVCNQTGGSDPIPYGFNGTSQGNQCMYVDMSDNIAYNWNGHMIVYGNDAQLTGSSFRRNKFDNFSTSGFLITYSNNTGAAVISYDENRFNKFGASLNWFSIAGGSPSSATFAQWQSQVGDTTSTTGVDDYADPSRTVIRYSNEVLSESVSTIDDFVNILIGQSKNNWNTQKTASSINTWMRAGFLPYSGSEVILGLTGNFNIDAYSNFLLGKNLNFSDVFLINADSILSLTKVLDNESFIEIDSSLSGRKAVNFDLNQSFHIDSYSLLNKKTNIGSSSLLRINSYNILAKKVNFQKDFNISFLETNRIAKNSLLQLVNNFSINSFLDLRKFISFTKDSLIEIDSQFDLTSINYSFIEILSNIDINSNLNFSISKTLQSFSDLRIFSNINNLVRHIYLNFENYINFISYKDLLKNVLISSSNTIAINSDQRIGKNTYINAESLLNISSEFTVNKYTRFNFSNILNITSLNSLRKKTYISNISNIQFNSILNLLSEIPNVIEIRSLISTISYLNFLIKKDILIPPNEIYLNSTRFNINKLSNLEINNEIEFNIINNFHKKSIFNISPRFSILDNFTIKKVLYFDVDFNINVLSDLRVEFLNYIRIISNIEFYTQNLLNKIISLGPLSSELEFASSILNDGYVPFAGNIIEWLTFNNSYFINLSNVILPLLTKQLENQLNVMQKISVNPTMYDLVAIDSAFREQYRNRFSYLNESISNIQKDIVGINLGLRDIDSRITALE